MLPSSLSLLRSPQARVSAGSPFPSDRRSRVRTAAFAMLSLLAVSTLSALPPGTWTQTFSEEFNGTSLDTTRWSTGYLWSPIINKELQAMRPENITFSGTTMNIRVEKRTSRNQSFGGYEIPNTSPYSSGCITTFNKFTQTYGYFEARIQVPSSVGAWPAFWLLPDRGPAHGPAHVDNTGQRSKLIASGLPRGNEIDVLESFGSWKRSDGTARAHAGFFWDYSGGTLNDYFRQSGLGDFLYIANPDTTWHTYGVYWAEGAMTFYLDDQIVGYWSSTNVASAPHYLILSCAVASNDWQGPPYATGAEIDAGLPGDMKVDWVRVYSGTATAPVPFTTAWVGRDLNDGSAGLPIGTDGWNAGFTANTVTSAGVWGMGDANGDWGRMSFKSLNGDGSIVARVTRIDDVGSSDATAGVIIRETANFRSKSAYVFVSPTYKKYGMKVRTSDTSVISGTSRLGKNLPTWMKLVRSGDTFTGYFSDDGSNWGTPVYSSTIPMHPIVQIGLATSSRTANVTTAVYDNITVTPSVPPGGNIALNRPAVASSIQTASLTAAAAVDGNSSTRWGSTFADNQWIFVDLGQSASISRVKLKWEAAYASGYKIQVSNDAVNWTDIFSTPTGNGGIDDLTGLSGTGRYVRVLGVTRATGFGISLFDFEVYP